MKTYEEEQHTKRQWREADLRHVDSHLTTNYIVYYQQGFEHRTTDNSEVLLLLDDPRVREIILHYATGAVWVDGSIYRRSDYYNYSGGEFFTLKEQQSHFDSPHFMLHDCRYCEIPFELDEHAYLNCGNILCARCGN